MGVPKLCTRGRYAEGMASEDAAISEFETFTQDSKVSRAAKETEVKNKAAERQRIGPAGGGWDRSLVGV